MNPRQDLHKHLHPNSQKLRVLHIGNIANNGYNIANLFNQAGVQSDLVIGPYYHFAACPEWEDAEFDGDIGDQFNPAWHRVKITNGFERPRWVAQGPWELCINYLLHKNKGNRVRALIYWQWLKVCQRASSSLIEKKTQEKLKFRVSDIIGNPRKIVRLIARKKTVLAVMKWNVGSILYLGKHYGYLVIYYSRQAVFRVLRSILLSNPVTKPLFYFLRNKRRKKIAASALSVNQTGGSHGSSLEGSECQEYDGVTHDELHQFYGLAHQMEPLFEYYDVVVGYSTDGIWPLLVGKPYIAYEHGTIRILPFEDSLMGRICKLVYKSADGVIVSNFDNNIAAEKLGLKNYTCIPHYINEMEVSKTNGESIRQKYLHERNSDFIVYNPSRQHWSSEQDSGWEKGNDIFIRGFAEFVKTVNPNAIAILTHWGESIDASKSLIDTLGINENVDWVEPVPHKEMIDYILASHVVSDQFLLGTFGGIPAKAFMHARPVLSSFDSKIHEWCFKEMPPFLPAKSVTEIVNSLSKCYSDSNFYKEVAEKGSVWYLNYHSNEVLLTKMSKILRDLV